MNHDELMVKINQRYWKMFNHNSLDQTESSIEHRTFIQNQYFALRAVVELHKPDWDEYEDGSGCLCGNEFPCQDLSVAGKRAGLAGERSGLFWHAARLVEETKTEWFIIENVPGLLSSNDGKDFGIVLGTMAELGYSVSWRILDAQYFGVPQRRRRVFVVGRLAGGNSPAEVLFKSEGLRGNLKQSQPQRQDTTRIAATGFGETSFAQYAENRISTLKASGGVMGGGSETFVVHEE